MLSNPSLRGWWARNVLLTLLLMSLTGCSAVAVWLGLRIRLDKVPVTAVSVAMVAKRGTAVATVLGPGQSARLVLVASTADGKQYPTVGAGNGKVAFDNYTIDATIVQVSKRGVVSLSADPRVSEGKTPHLRITTIAHPEVTADLDIPLAYDIAFVADYNGAAGANGFDGLAESDGSSGSDGSPPTADPTTGVFGTMGLPVAHDRVNTQRLDVIDRGGDASQWPPATGT